MSSESSDTRFSDAWQRWRSRVDLDEYDVRWDRMEAEGQAVHGEAAFIDLLGGELVLDAGCGTGRVAAELSRRGRQVVAADNDGDMLRYARRKPEPVRWVQGDLATLSFPEVFDVVAMAGNILVFVLPESRAAVVANMARHLRPGGQLVMGFGASEGCDFPTVDGWCDDANLVLEEQYATWDRQLYEGGEYRVSVHRRLFES